MTLRSPISASVLLLVAASITMPACGAYHGWQKRREADDLEERIETQRESLRKMSRSQLEAAEVESRERAISQYRKILDEYSDIGGEELDESLYLLARLLFDREQEAFEEGQARFEAARVRAEETGATPPQEPLARYPESRESLERLLREFPQSSYAPDALYDLGYIESQEGNLDAAIARFERLLDEHPTSRYAPEVHFRLGEFAFEDFDLRKAQTHYQATLDAGVTEFTPKARFKLGWVDYNLNRYDEAKSVLASLLESQLSDVEREGEDLAPAPILFFPGPRRQALSLERVREPRGDLYPETLEILARVFMESGGHESLLRFIEERKRGGISAGPWEAALLHRLALVEKERALVDAAESSYRSLLETYPTYEATPQVDAELVELLLEQGQEEKVARLREGMLERYDRGSPWARAHPQQELREEAQKKGREALEWAIDWFHARGMKKQEDTGGAPEELAHAIELYERYLARFPDGADSYERRFRMGQALFAAGRFRDAAAVFQTVSFDDNFGERREEAAFARVLSVEKLGGEGPVERDVLEARVAAYEDYIRLNPQSERNPTLLFKEGQLYFDAGLHPQAIAALQRLVRRHESSELRPEAEDLIAQSLFELGQYAEAETWAQSALGGAAPSGALAGRRDQIRNLYALTIFKQGETADGEGKGGEAATHFLRLVERLPEHESAPRALYNAADSSESGGDVDGAVGLFERLLADYPESELAPDAAARLASVYKDRENGARDIVRVYERVADHHPRDPRGEEFLFLAGKIAAREDWTRDVQRLFTKYLDRYAGGASGERAERAHAARYHVGSLLFAAGDTARGTAHLERFLSSAEPRPGVFGEGENGWAWARAHAVTLLSDRMADDYQAVRIRPPIQKNLAQKERLLDGVVASYERAVATGISPFATRASFSIGRAHEQFAEALLDAPKPRGLSSDELREYDEILEGHVRPYLVDAVEAYRELLAAAHANDVDDEWTAKSRQRLAELAPRVFHREPDPGYRRLDPGAGDGPALATTWAGETVRPQEKRGFFGSLFANETERKRSAFAEGWAHARGGRFAEAAAAFREAEAPTAPEARYNAAVCLVRLGRMDEAARDAEWLAAEAPTFSDGLLLAARLARDRGDEARAVELLSSAAAANPDGSQLLLAEALERAGKRDEAIAAYEKASTHGASAAAATLALVRLDGSERASKLRGLVPALRNDPDRLIEIGLLASERGRPDIAREAFRQAGSALEGRDAPTRGLLLLDEAAAAWEMGRLDDAAALVDRARELGGDPAMQHNVSGLIELRQGRFERAATLFRESLTVSPTYRAPWVNLGIVMELYLARPGEALESYRKAAGLDAGDGQDVEQWVEELQGGSR